MYRSMEANYEGGLIGHKTLKRQSLNVFLLINYCLQSVCIRTHVYSVLGT